MGEGRVYRSTHVHGMRKAEKISTGTGCFSLMFVCTAAAALLRAGFKSRRRAFLTRLFRIFM